MHLWKIQQGVKSKNAEPVFVVIITYFIAALQNLKKDQFYHWKLCPNYDKKT